MIWGKRIAFLFLSFWVLIDAAHSQTVADERAAGKKIFLARCAACHGTTGEGGEFAPGIANRVPLHSNDELKSILHDGLASGMPAFSDLAGDDREALIAHLRTLNPAGTFPAEMQLSLADGRSVKGTALNRSELDLQLLTDDRRVLLLRKHAERQYREVTSQNDWPHYDGPDSPMSNGGSRFSTLAEINTGNVAKLQVKWVFNLRNALQSQATPIVKNGLMYVTSANECFALDAGSGRLVWRYQRPRTPGIGGVGARGVNRGATYDNGMVFLHTDNAHLIALSAATGALVWDTPVADWHDNYNATSAPLAAGDLVISGVAGGDDGARGFIAAFDQHSGKEVWRFWSVPRPGEPNSGTWKGAGIEHPGGAAWMTGVYDRDLDQVLWPIGNPGNDLIGDKRAGSNLYTDSVVALEPKSGKLKWYFQFTPHDLHDFDAAEPLALINAPWEGKPRKLLVQANRNGYFYVLDRTNGKFLRGNPYTTKLNWATGLDSSGHPKAVPASVATVDGNRVCPWLIGASNWPSSSYNPVTSLYYVQTDDKCGIYTRTEAPFAKGQGFMGGSFAADPKDPGVRILRALDIRTGQPAWEYSQVGLADSFGGVLSTAGKVVFFGGDDGTFTALHAENGGRLWGFQTNQMPHASPMTYEFDHRQFVAVAAGSDILAFGLPE